MPDGQEDFTALRKRLPLSAIRKVSISLKKLGINTAISATYMVAGFIEQMSVVENLVNCLPLDQGNLVINELMIGKNSPVAGEKTV